MRDLTSYVILFVAVVGTAMSKPLWSTLAGGNYLYPTSEINELPQYLAAQQNAHSPYYVYNVHTNIAGVPAIAVLTSGKPQLSRIPGYSLYYGTPIYDLRIPLNPVYPVLTPVHPGLPPKPILPPTFGEQPGDVDGDIDIDGIEKLDSKVDPNTGTKKPGGNEQDDDSITVEAI